MLTHCHNVVCRGLDHLDSLQHIMLVGLHISLMGMLVLPFAAKSVKLPVSSGTLSKKNNQGFSTSLCYSFL